MYSVREVANRLDISRQAVYKRINKESFKEFIILNEESKYISEEGFQVLKKGSIKAKEIIETSKEQVDINFGELQTVDNRLVDTLNSIIESKDEDIKDLKVENKKLLQLMEQQNQLLHNSQKIQQQALSTTEQILLEKRQQLLIRETEYKLNRKLSWKHRLRILFKGK